MGRTVPDEDVFREKRFLRGHNVSGHLHGHTHRVAEVDDDEGDDREPLLLGERRHRGQQQASLKNSRDLLEANNFGFKDMFPTN